MNMNDRLPPTYARIRYARGMGWLHGTVFGLFIGFVMAAVIFSVELPK